MRTSSIFFISGSILLSSLLFLFGCSEVETTTTCSPKCVEGQVCENGTCVDIQVNSCESKENCDLGMDCVGKKCTCVQNGKYVECLAGQYCCTQGCIDLDSDKENCGQCGAVCDAEQGCVRGSCTGTAVVCEDGKKRCNGLSVELCDQGAWVHIESCKANEICDDLKSECVQANCTNGQFLCDKNTVMQCQSNSWKIYSTCDPETQLCDANFGTCTDLVCKHGEMRCNGQVIQKCVDNQYTNQETCTGNTTCTEEGVTVTCKEEVKKDPECGNNVKEADEDCDGSDLNQKTCADVVTGSSGTLSCTTSCTFDITQCEIASTCTVGETMCKGAEHQECAPGNKWETVFHCGVDTSAAICDVDNICICNVASDCKDTKSPYCHDQTCVECEPNTTSCDGNTYITCDANGKKTTKTCSGATPQCHPEKGCEATNQERKEIFLHKTYFSDSHDNTIKEDERLLLSLSATIASAGGSGEKAHWALYGFPKNSTLDTSAVIVQLFTTSELDTYKDLEFSFTYACNKTCSNLKVATYDSDNLVGTVATVASVPGLVDSFPEEIFTVEVNNGISSKDLNIRLSAEISSGSLRVGNLRLTGVKK